MKNVNMLRVLILTVGLCLCLPAYADLKDVSLMALSPVDNRVVVKTAEGMQVLKVGDTVPGTQAVIKQVLVGKLVLEETVSVNPLLKDKVWLYKPSKPGGKSRLQRLTKSAPPKQVHKSKTVFKEGKKP